MRVIVPGGESPIRVPEQVAQGLGLPPGLESQLSEKVREWMHQPNQLALRRSLIKGLRAFTTTYPVRAELWRRSMELWRNTEATRPYRERPDETVVQKSERIVGGKGDNRPDSDFDAEQLAEGLKHEMEHTKDRAVAKEIAKDHLAESPKYYEGLEKMEEGLKGKKEARFNPDTMLTGEAAEEHYRKAGFGVEESKDFKKLIRLNPKR